jgi:hypothetical protein
MSWFAVTKNQKKIGSLAHVFHFLSRVKQVYTPYPSPSTKYQRNYAAYDELDSWDRGEVERYMIGLIQVIDKDIETTITLISKRLNRRGSNYDSERQYRLATEKPMVELFKQGKIPERLIGFDDITNMDSDDIIRTWKEFRTEYPEFCKIYLTTHPVPRYVQLIKNTISRKRRYR